MCLLPSFVPPHEAVTTRGAAALDHDCRRACTSGVTPLEGMVTECTEIVRFVGPCERPDVRAGAGARLKSLGRPPASRPATLTPQMDTGGRDVEDPFAGVVLDADFVKGARRRELSDAERRGSALRARAERDRLAEIERNERRKRRINRRAIRAVRGRRIGPMVTVAVVGALIVYMAWWGRSGEGGIRSSGFSALGDRRKPPNPTRA